MDPNVRQNFLAFFVRTVNIGLKEWQDLEQLDNNEPFHVTNMPVKFKTSSEKN